MSSIRLLHKIRHKKSKTQAEELLLRYWHTISNICEVTVQESKHHIDSNKAIEEIRKYIREGATQKEEA